MGWLWGSSEPTSEPNHQEAQPPTTTPPETPPAPLSRNEQAFADLKDLFSQLDPERSERAAAAAAQRAAAPAPDTPADSDTLYPSTMSCSQAFDLAYYCSSVGGQLNNVYRFGGLRSCTAQWAAWRFCMRTKALGEDARRERIREFYQRRAAEYRVGRSSEDVWTARAEPVENPFRGSVDLYEY